MHPHSRTFIAALQGVRTCLFMGVVQSARSITQPPPPPCAPFVAFWCGSHFAPTCCATPITTCLSLHTCIARFFSAAEDTPDVEVRREDQQNINEFGRLNTVRWRGGRRKTAVLKQTPSPVPSPSPRDTPWLSHFVTLPLALNSLALVRFCRRSLPLRVTDVMGGWLSLRKP